MKVLLVEDSIEIVEMIQVTLEIRWPGVVITHIETGRLAATIVASERPDMVILDLGLPDIDGLEVLEQIRAGSDVPVIILTSRGHETARVRGLESGADDYMLKPFSPAELLARVHAVIRRVVAGAKNSSVTSVTRDSLTVDLVERNTCVGEKVVRLSRLEWDVLAHLAGNTGNVIERVQLKLRGWGSSVVDDSVVKMCVRRIRRKIEDAGGNGSVIVTHRGTGYSLAGPDQP